jgi:hypothetical protein
MRLSGSLLVLSLALSGCAGAPTPLVSSPGGTIRTRPELERLLADYEAALVSPDYSEAEKQSLRADADAVRARLEFGDFRVGDRIMVTVQGEADLPDTITVEPGPAVSLGLFGDVPVGGVLRSEITGHLREALSRTIRDPVVRATGLMRVSVIGAIGAPGFYTMPAETVLGEALMLAGGPSAQANLEELRITRGSRRVLQGQALRDALRAGYTLDQLNLLAGDQIEVPERRGILATLGLVSGVVGSLSFLFWFLVGN